MNPNDLLATARELAGKRGSGRPRQSNLRRAASTTYYALFHCLARDTADLIVGGKGSNRKQRAWLQAYRSLDHGAIKRKCKSEEIDLFPGGIRKFATLFAYLQEIRHQADYNPAGKFSKFSVLNDIERAESVIGQYRKSAREDRRAFVVYVVMSRRKI